MKLKAATIRNYRVHQNLDVEFDPQLTLITGPNESGKSTLAEAIHRGLFLRHKSTSEERRAMDCDHGGHPEVEICFEANGKEGTLNKVFKKQSGTFSLNIAGEKALAGDAAEEALATLLQSGRGGKPQQYWSHLWVWQGTSGEDPAGTVAGQQEALIQRLQSMGGNALVLSGLDARIAKDLVKKQAELFTKTDEPRANTR